LGLRGHDPRRSAVRRSLIKTPASRAIRPQHNRLSSRSAVRNRESVLRGDRAGRRLRRRSLTTGTGGLGLDHGCDSGCPRHDRRARGLTATIGERRGHRCIERLRHLVRLCGRVVSRAHGLLLGSLVRSTRDHPVLSRLFWGWTQAPRRPLRRSERVLQRDVHGRRLHVLTTHRRVMPTGNARQAGETVLARCLDRGAPSQHLELVGGAAAVDHREVARDRRLLRVDVGQAVVPVLFEERRRSLERGGAPRAIAEMVERQP